MKKVQLAAIAVGVIFLAGCGNKAANDQAGPSKQAQSSAQEKQAEKPVGVISSIKEAMGLGQTMKCTYTEKVNGKTFVSEAYVNGKKYKAANEIEGKKMNSLFDGETIYSWTNGEKKGQRMKMDCLENLFESDKKDGKASYVDEFQGPEEEFEDATDEKCEPASGVDFSPPSDVNFEDQCQAMKSLMETMGSKGTL